MVTGDDKVEGLSEDTKWKALELSGGALAWVAIILSFFMTSIYGKWADLSVMSTLL